MSNQTARLYATAKTHKFEDHNLITTENLKLRLIISTCGTYFYETAKALAKYLAPLTERIIALLRTPLNLPFYNRYVDDCCTKRKANAPDILLENLNSYHPNIKFTVEENPDHFLDTSFTHQERHFITKVHQKPGKLQVHWKSAIPHKWKRNTILGAQTGVSYLSFCVTFFNECGILFDPRKVEDLWYSSPKEFLPQLTQKGYRRSWIEGSSHTSRFRRHFTFRGLVS